MVSPFALTSDAEQSRTEQRGHVVKVPSACFVDAVSHATLVLEAEFSVSTASRVQESVRTSAGAVRTSAGAVHRDDGNVRTAFAIIFNKTPTRHTTCTRGARKHGHLACAWYTTLSFSLKMANVDHMLPFPC